MYDTNLLSLSVGNLFPMTEFSLSRLVLAIKSTNDHINARSKLEHIEYISRDGYI